MLDIKIWALIPFIENTFSFTELIYAHQKLFFLLVTCETHKMF